jgi:hypothetical protein
MINDAAMQAFGSYRGGTMLFLGPGTGLGAALIVNGTVVPKELGHFSIGRPRHPRTAEAGGNGSSASKGPRNDLSPRCCLATSCSAAETSCSLPLCRRDVGWESTPTPFPGDSGCRLHPRRREDQSQFLEPGGTNSRCKVYRNHAAPNEQLTGDKGDSDERVF